MLKFKEWCRSNNSLLGLTFKHPGLGKLIIISIHDRSINTDKVTLGSDFFWENIKICLDHSDFKNVYRTWKQDCVRISREAEERKQRIASEKKQRALSAQERNIRLLKISREYNFATSDNFINKVTIIPPALRSLDIKLAEEWANHENFDESTMRRLYSARLAEVAAQIFYKKCGFKVIDVSIHQIKNRGSSDWKDFDLLVNNRPVDIKNARQSEKNPERYVSFCVPRFKELKERNRKRDVVVAGVLSPWLPIETMKGEHSPYYTGSTNVIFMGEASRNHFQELIKHFNLFEHNLSFEKNGNKAKFLPPWMWQYPESLYRNRRKSVAEFQKFTEQQWVDWHQDKFNVWPGLVLSGNYKLISILGFPESTRKLGDLFIRLHLAKMLTLPSVFLGILTHFIDCLQRKVSFDAECCHLLIFESKSKENYPFFFYDPLKVISNLIATLSHMSDTSANLLGKFKIFQLKSLNFFQGKSDKAEEKWTSLIAYCGGLLNNKKPCGITPLVLGMHPLCECKRLICPRCKFCSPGCEDGKRRQDLQDMSF